MVCRPEGIPTAAQWFTYYMPWGPGICDLKGQPIPLADVIEWMTDNYDVEPDQLANFRLLFEAERVPNFNSFDASPL